MPTVRRIKNRLETVQAAIRKIEDGGQSVEINGRTLTKANLSTLYSQERRLERLLSRKERGGLLVRRGVPLDG